MADNNPSNFVSWGQQMGLTGDLEKTLYERALKAAQDEQSAAKSSLESAYGQARDANRQEVADTGAASTTLQQTGSYNDYLKHQAQAQAKASAALQGGNSVSTLMRQQLAPRAWGSTANFDQGTQALLQRQAQLEQQRQTGVADDISEIAFHKEQAKRSEEMAAQNAAASDAARQKHAADILNNAKSSKWRALQNAVATNPSPENQNALLNYAATQAYNAQVAGKSWPQVLGAYMGALGNAASGPMRRYQLGQLGEYGAGEGADPAVLNWLKNRIQQLAANSGGAFLVVNG